MNKLFGTLPNGQQATLYTIRRGNITAVITDYGATLVQLWVPDAQGNIADVVLGYDDVNSYRTGTGFLGATVGRSANRIQNASFSMNGTTVTMTPNEGSNNLHSGPDFYKDRLWKATYQAEDSITFQLDSPHGDQGFPGNATIDVTYSLDGNRALVISYRAISDRDTVFNMTNHSYFNLAGHDHPEKAMDQMLTLPARFFNPDDSENIPTGELCSVEGTPMDFRTPKALKQDIEADYEPLHLQGGYDHNFEVFCNPCAVLTDPVSGRSMTVTTDCPGIQVYTANFLDDTGKGGVRYAPRCGVALETQFYPNSVNNPQWPQPFVKAHQVYRSVTKYQFH